MTTYTKKFKEFIQEWNPDNNDYIVGYRSLDDSEIRIPLLAVDNSITANKYIRKDIDDYANGIIRFNKGFTVSSNVMSTIYLQGLDGWKGTQEGDFEMNSLILREFLEVPELRKNKITVMGNQFWFTDSAMVREAIATGSGNYDIYFKLEEEEYAPFELNDILKGIYHYSNGFWTVYLKVYELILNPDTQGEIGIRVHSMNGRDPRSSMLLARINNSDDKERQGSIFADGLRKYIRVLDGYTESDPTSEGNLSTLKVQMGDLSTITNHPLFGNLKGYGLYADNVYLQGKLIVKNDPNKPGQELGVYRGVWDPKANYYKFDQVTYKGSLYTSKQKDNIGHVPNGGPDDLWWELTVSKGDDGTSGEANIIIELTNDNHNIPTDSEGKNPSYGGADCTAFVYEGVTDITEIFTITATLESPTAPEKLQFTQNKNTVVITYIADDIDNAAIKFTANAAGYPTVSKIWTITKVKSGTPGEPSTAYWIVTDSPVIKKIVTKVDDVETVRYEPNPFVIRGLSQTGQGPILPYNGYFKLTYGSQTQVIAGSIYQFTPTADVTSYNIEFYKDSLLTTLLDKEYVSVVSDGKDGVNQNWHIYIFKKSEFMPETPTFTTPPTLYPIEGWFDYPTSEGIWWMSTAVVSGALNKIVKWSVPIKTTGEDGVDGADGVDGTNGVSSFKSIVFLRQNTIPSTPIGGSFDVPVPPGWSDGVPDGTAKLWSSSRIFTSDGSFPQTETWSTPSQMTDTASFEVRYSTVILNPGDPTTNPSNWTTASSTNSIWMATRTMANGVWSPWQVSKIKGESGADGTSIVWKGTFPSHPDNPQNGWSYYNSTDKKSYVYQSGAWYQMTVDGAAGQNGNSTFKSTVFRRTNSTPVDPIGGSYTNPVPAGWSDGVPVGTEKLWVSTRIFTSDGNAPQQAAWTMPSQMTDTASFQVRYSTIATAPGNPTNNPSNWSTTASDKTIWMATRDYANGVWSEWQISKIKGEDGKNGIDIVWKGDLKDPPANPQLNWVYRDTDNKKVYIWNGSAWELMVVDGTDGTDGANGANGLSVHITYHDNGIYNKPAKPTGDGTTNGWHTAPTSDCVWMSQKVSDSATTGVWGDPIQIRGADGGYVDFKYALSANANTPPKLDKNTRYPNGWSDVPPSVSAGTFLWMISAFINPDNTLGAQWSDPMRISGETGPQGPQGTQGLHGADGLQGPSIVFAGNWSATTQYYGYNDTQTCVYYSGKYYYTKTVSPNLSPLTIPTGVANNPASDTGEIYWNEFVGQFDNIATGLLLAERIATSELTANKLFIVDREESSGNIIAADGSIITKNEEKNLTPAQIIGRLNKGWYMDQGLIRSIAVNNNGTPKLKLDRDGKITATGVEITGTVYFQNGTIGTMQVFNTADWLNTVNGPYPASKGFYYLRKDNGVTITPQGHIIGKDYFLTGDSTQGPSVFIGDVYVPGDSVPGTSDNTLSSFLKLFNSLFERVLIGSQYFIKAKLPLFSVGEVTANGSDTMTPPSFWDGIPVDKTTIDLIDGKLTVIGGTSGGGGITNIIVPSMTVEEALVGASLSNGGKTITFSKGMFATKNWVTSQIVGSVPDLSNYVTKTGTGATGVWSIGSTSVDSIDERSTPITPATYYKAARFLFRSNTIDSLTDGGAYHGVLHFKPYGGTNDFTGGQTHQLGFTDNGNLHLRTSTNSTTWGSWNMMLHTGNYTTTLDARYVNRTGDTMSGELYVKTVPSNTWKGFIASSTITNTTVFGTKSDAGAHLGYIRVGSVLQYNNGTDNTIWHSGNDGAGSGLNADLLDGYHESVFVRDRYIGGKSDYQNVVILLFEDNVVSYQRITGKLYSATSGATRYQYADLNVWHSRWALGGIGASSDYSFGINTDQQGAGYRLVTVTYGGKLWWALQHTNTQATSFYFQGTSLNVDWTVIPYYTTNTSTVNNAEINSSITNSDSKTSSMIKGGYVNYATLDDNVASATKLQTARTLWGNSFDGTANVSGRILATSGVRTGSDGSDWPNVGVFASGSTPLVMYGSNGTADTRRYYFATGANYLAFGTANDTNIWTANIASFYHNGNVIWYGTQTYNNRIAIQSDGKIIPNSTSTRRSGMYGIYDSYKIGHIWSMGTAYTIADDGSNFGNMYGFAYKHTNNTTGGEMASGHQAVWCENGVPYAALGRRGLWTSEWVTIGNARLQWDEDKLALKLVHKDGSTAINFYSLGEVTAGGASSGGGGSSGSVDMPYVWTQLAAATNEQINKSHLITALTSTSVIAGAGLTGGGTINNSVTLALATSGVAAGTYVRTTVDVYGRVTAGSGFSVSDIPALNVWDIRDTNPAPNSGTWFQKGVTAWFNQTGMPTNTWWSGITVKGWQHDYAVWQLAGYSSTANEETHLYYRRGLNTTWGAWSIILDDSNYTSFCPTKSGTGATGTWGIDVTGSAGTLSGYTWDSFSQRARYATKGSNSSGYYKININSTASYMIAFTIRVYQSYQYYDIAISGYNYNTTKTWYEAKAISLGSSLDVVNVTFGKDADNMLWVAIPAGSYTGIEVCNICNGYEKIDNWADKISISYQATLTGTVFNTIPVKRSANIGDNVESATSLKTARTIWGQSFDGTANVSGAITGATTITTSSHIYVAGTIYNNGSGESIYVAQNGALEQGRISFSDSNLIVSKAGNGMIFFRPNGDVNTTGEVTINNSGTLTAPTFSGALSGNASSATKLQTARAINGTNFDGTTAITTALWGTARNLTIANQTVSINGSTNYSFNRSDMGVARGDEVSYSVSASANTWYRIAYTSVDIGNAVATFGLRFAASGRHNVLTLQASITFGQNPNINQLGNSSYGSSAITQARIVYNSTYAGNYAYLEVLVPISISMDFFVAMSNNTGWVLYSSQTSAGIPSGYSTKVLPITSTGLGASGYLYSQEGLYLPGGVVYTNNGGYAEISSGGNEIVVSNTSSTDLYVNYRTGSYRAAVPTRWLWRAGSGTSYANFDLGDLYARGTLAVDGFTSLRDDVSVGGALNCAARSSMNGGLNVGYTNTSYSLSANTFICNSWIRTTGGAGWYSEAYGGGIHMTDVTWVRIAYSKKFYVSNTEQDAIYTSGGVRIGNAVLQYDSTNNALYVTKSDGGICNFYTTGDLSAGGAGAETFPFDYASDRFYVKSGKYFGVGSINTSYNANVEGTLRVSSSILTGTLNVTTVSATTLTTGTAYASTRLNVGSNSNTTYTGYFSGTLYASGQVYSNGTAVSSDETLKDIGRSLTISVEDIASSPFFEFTWKDRECGKDIQIGTSAQYWQNKVYNGVIRLPHSGKLAMRYAEVALLCSKEIAKKVLSVEDELRAKIKKLEEEVEQLKLKLK